MTQKELEQKVIDAEGRVAKREAVLKKHNSQLAKMIEKGADRFDVSIKREDIKSATSKLAEARETLANWQDKLNTRITRDAYPEANTPEILKDFLESWKRHAIGYYQEKRIRFIKYREGLKAEERAARLEALQILFLESENSTTDVMNGDFRWDIAVTPTPPLKSASVYVAYTDAGFSVYYEGGDE